MQRPQFRLSLLITLAGLQLFCVASFSVAEPLPQSDLQFLNRVSYGPTLETVDALRKLGRQKYIDQQLQYQGDKALPEAVRAEIEALNISETHMVALVKEYEAEHKLLKSATGNTDRQALKKDLHKKTQSMLLETFQRRTLRALYSRNQLQEMLTWFWFNHFNVFQGKGAVKVLIPDYEEYAIRPHVLGKFRDLLLATLKHPAMLVYLDNRQNHAGAINENYARELMELHTLGVNGGYSQKDVQELARILTGTGVHFGDRPIRPPRHGPMQFVQEDLFVFNPRQHDGGPKTFLGAYFGGEHNFQEVIDAVSLLARHPSTAKFISTKLAVYFLGDTPPDDVIESMAKIFTRSDGDIAKTLESLFASSAFTGGDFAGKEFKDPVQYLYSSLRLLYADQVIANFEPPLHWLNHLGEPLYGKQTPDGYGLREKDWASSDQMTKRFDIARQMVNSRGNLFFALGKERSDVDEDQLRGARRQAKDSHPIDARAVQEMVTPLLSPNTQETLKKTATFDEWATFLLSSPEWMMR